MATSGRDERARGTTLSRPARAGTKRPVRAGASRSAGRRPFTRSPLAALVAAAAITACAAAGASDPPLVAHTFDTSDEGWLIAGDTQTRRPDFHPTGGQSGGFIVGDDEALGETWYFRAPDEVLRRLPSAFGGRISYSLKQSDATPGYLDDDVVIVGPAGRLSYRFAKEPGTDWTDFSVDLRPSVGWQWNWNRDATADQIRSVLANASRLEIRGEYQTGPDEGGLDTFVLARAR
jgi:Laminin B (Domain IV)